MPQFQPQPPAGQLPLPKYGADVVSPEGGLESGAARRAHNLVIDDTGRFRRRPGFDLSIVLPDAHSLWDNDALVLCAAQRNLYSVNLAAQSVTAIFSGLALDRPVEYAEAGGTVYFASPSVLGKISPDGGVRRPGVAKLWGYMPTLTATVGGRLPGRYGVAYSLINDLGEESPISSIAWIDLPSGGGILVSGLQFATDVTHMNLYATTANGEELYLASTQLYAATASITDQRRIRRASKQYLEPMPGGDIVRYYNGHLYVACGAGIYVSEGFDYGVYHIKRGYIPIGKAITIMEPVDSGIFVGTREKVVFLQGGGPGEFTLADPAAQRGAFAHSGTSVPADFLDDTAAPDRGKPVAVWMSEVGMAVGRPDGSVSFPQASRVIAEGDVARPAFLQRNGLKQGIFCGATLGVGAVDTTI
jgi:hypothetical protein